ncbi:MAG: tRNA adenosine(34) deaminase TadA [Oligoflexales bacterium]|nr:tRNA adenosine(34) deaminase TadA [Oligoflexales bacterium]
MRQALDRAYDACQIGEIPVGALIVFEGAIIASGFNQKEREQCSTKHAEILAIEEASRHLQNFRLLNCDMYVTLEPCLMCAGALYQARIRKVFFGAHDPKAGALGSLYSIHQDSRLNHRFEAEGGILTQESQTLLKDFFQKRRKHAK